MANSPQNLSSGSLYVYKGSKNGSGDWIQLNNTTQAEQNSTVVQSANVGATVLPATDCDDSNALLTIEVLWYLDENQDGYADELPVTSCNRPDTNYTKDELPLFSTLTTDGPILYPNPTESEVTVLLEKTYEELFIEVYTLNRKRVLKKTMSNANQITFELTNQPTGLYFLQIISEGKRIGFYKVDKL